MEGSANPSPPLPELRPKLETVYKVTKDDVCPLKLAVGISTLVSNELDELDRSVPLGKLSTLGSPVYSHTYLVGPECSVLF